MISGRSELLILKLALSRLPEITSLPLPELATSAPCEGDKISSLEFGVGSIAVGFWKSSKFGLVIFIIRAVKANDSCCA